MSYQFDWSWGTDGLYHISKTDIGTVMDCVVSISLAKGQSCTVISIELMLEQNCTVSYM